MSVVWMWHVIVAGQAVPGGRHRRLCADTHCAGAGDKHTISIEITLTHHRRPLSPRPSIRFATTTCCSSTAGIRISSNHASNKVFSSSLLMQVLLGAKAAGRRFRVIVVDSRPKLDGRGFAMECARTGIKTSYCLVNSISYVLREVGGWCGWHLLMCRRRPRCCCRHTRCSPMGV